MAKIAEGDSTAFSSDDVSADDADNVDEVAPIVEDGRKSFAADEAQANDADEEKKVIFIQQQ